MSPIESITRAREAAVAQAFPGAILWTREQAEQATGLCSKTLSRHVKPVHIGRAVRWIPGHVQKWVDSLSNGARGEAAVHTDGSPERVGHG